MGPALRALGLDFASTIFFLLLYALTRNLTLSVSLGFALAAGQIGLRLLRRQRVDALQWVSALIVALSGAATLITRDPTFVMLKPTVLYLMAGGAMLQRGWMTRYMPPPALEYVPDLVIGGGYVWAGLMFLSAGLNLVLALETNVLVWGSVMSVWGFASKSALFFVQYTFMRAIGRRRRLAREAAAA